MKQAQRPQPAATADEPERAVAALREEVDRWRLVAEFTYDWEFWRSPDRRFLYMSPSCERVTGYPREAFLEEPDLYLRIVHPDDRQRVADHLRDDRIAGEAFECEFRIVRRDGRERWIAHACQPVSGANGQPLGRRASNRDITDRKQAEEALRQLNADLARRVSEQTAEILRQNAYHRSLIEASPDPLVTIGPDGKITDVNAASEGATGLARDALIGTDFADYFTEPERAHAGYRLVFREGLVRDYPLEIRHRDGHVTPVLYNATVYRNAKGEVEGVFAAARDIAARQRAEKARDAERQRFYDVLETLPVYVVLLSQDYHVPFANRFFRERFGEAHGQRCFEYLFQRTAPCENCESYKTLQTQAPHHWEWTGPDGRDYDIHDFPFVDTDGSPMIMEMGIDVTNAKKAHAALQELNATLEQRVAERTAELAASEEELRKHAQELQVANAELTRFNQAMIGRELRMLELKQEVNALCARTGSPPRYGPADAGEPEPATAAERGAEGTT